MEELKKKIEALEKDIQALQNQKFFTVKQVLRLYIIILIISSIVQKVVNILNSYLKKWTVDVNVNPRNVPSEELAQFFEKLGSNTEQK